MKLESVRQLTVPRSIVGVRIKAVEFSVTGGPGREVSLAQINFRHLLYLDSYGLD